MTDPAHNTPAGMMARLRAREHRALHAAGLDARIGAGVPGLVTYISEADVRALAASEDASFRALERDMHRDLVYDDPAAVRLAAATYQKLADGASVDEVKTSQQAIADALSAEASKLDTRAAALPAGDVQKQIDWSAGYRNFMERWNTFVMGEVDTIGPLSVTPNLWSTITEFDHEFRAEYAAYPGTPSTPLADSPETKLQNLRQGQDQGGPFQVPWTKILIGAGIVAGAYYLLTKRRAEATTVAVLPEVKVGRPEVVP